MSGHFLLQGIFPTQVLNPGLLHWRQILYHLSYDIAVVSSLLPFPGGPVDLPLPKLGSKNHTGGATVLSDLELPKESSIQAQTLLFSAFWL